MADPKLEGITNVTPSNRRFRFNAPNIFYITGQNLAGRRVETIAGALNTGTQVVWSDICTLDNTDPQRIRVVAMPRKAGTPWQLPEEPRDVDDPGTITPTVTGPFQQQLPTDYGA